MAMDGDVVVLQNSMADNMSESKNVPFYDKNYTFITDSTSNSGSFSSGQVQFDLSTLASQSSWVNLNEAVIEMPIKITAQLTTAGTGAETSASIAGINAAVIKNGWHSFIDGAQLIVNGQTIQSMQSYENVCAQFRILSTWSQDTLQKWGPTCGFSLDDCSADSDVSTTIDTTTNIGNTNYTTVATSVRGLDVINNQSSLFNKGVQNRASFTNYDISPANANVQSTILGASGMRNAGRNHAARRSGGSNVANEYLYSAFYMATIRVKDLFDINDFPLVKNLKGYLYLSFNSAQVNLTGTAGGTSLAAVSINVPTGRSCPFLVNYSSSGITCGRYATTPPVVQMTATVDGTNTGAQTNSGPLLTSARLLVPYYLANPRTDSALAQSNKFFTTLEKIVNPIVCTAGSSVNFTISVGVPNPRKLLLLPMWQNLGGATYLSNPEVSCFDSVPQSSSPWAQLNNLQVYVANKPIYQNPIQYDFEQWNNENSELGLNGNSVNEMTSGLLSEQLWTQNHRFYYIDISRRMESEDGASKSVQVQFTNPSASFGLKVIAVVFYEKQWVIDTSTCMLQNIK